jgi:hypothetical protein
MSTYLCHHTEYEASSFVCDTILPAVVDGEPVVYTLVDEGNDNEVCEWSDCPIHGDILFIEVIDP